VSFRIAQVTFMNANDAPAGGGDVKMPLPAGTSIDIKAEESVRTVRLSFSEPVQKDSLGAGTAAQITVEKLGGGLPVKVAVDVVMEDVDAVRVILRDPPSLQVGSYILRAKGTNVDGAPGGIVSESNTPLDGDYDGQPGGDFALPFQVE
jgi:hypothetical protein